MFTSHQVHYASYSLTDTEIQSHFKVNLAVHQNAKQAVHFFSRLSHSLDLYFTDCFLTIYFIFAVF